MGNVKLLFCGTAQSNTTEHSLEVFKNARNEVFISIDMCNGNGNLPSFICLDKHTAVKLSRELRKQISLLDDLDM